MSIWWCCRCRLWWKLVSCSKLEHGEPWPGRWRYPASRTWRLSLGWEWSIDQQSLHCQDTQPWEPRECPGKKRFWILNINNNKKTSLVTDMNLKVKVGDSFSEQKYLNKVTLHDNRCLQQTEFANLEEKWSFCLLQMTARHMTTRSRDNWENIKSRLRSDSNRRSLTTWISPSSTVSELSPAITIVLSQQHRECFLDWLRLR